MAQPGVVAKIDAEALTGIIVFFNSYRQLVEDNCEKIRAICHSMETEESLSGGDGDAIREAFADISDGCAPLVRSINNISKVLNEKLEVAVNMRHGKSVGDAGTAAKDAAKNVGVLKKE